MMANREEDIRIFVENICSAHAQASINEYMKKLKKKWLISTTVWLYIGEHKLKQVTLPCDCEYSLHPHLHNESIFLHVDFV